MSESQPKSQLETLVERLTALGINLERLLDTADPDFALLRTIFTSVPLHGNRQREEVLHCPETHRYSEVGCYPGLPIHGNVMEGTTLVDTFYATQCPLSSTVRDHLELIMKEELLIVFIMGATSTRIPKYLPEREGEEIVYGNITVKNLRARAGSPFRKFLLIRAGSEDGAQEEKTHCFYFFQASEWPDSSTPWNRNLISSLFRCALQIINYKVTPGVTNRICQLVHCSAGIGRTCTYIGIIQGIVRLLKTRVPFTYRFALELLFHLRDQRFAAIQTFEQFTYMLRYIKDWCDWAPEHDPGSLEIISRF